MTATILRVWEEQKVTTKAEAQNALRSVSLIQAKLDKLDDAFLFDEKVDRETYERQRDRLREEMTLAKMAKHSSDLDELDFGFDGKSMVRTPPRASAFNWLEAFRPSEKGVVDHTSATWNLIGEYLAGMRRLKTAA